MDVSSKLGVNLELLALSIPQPNESRKFLFKLALLALPAPHSYLRVRLNVLFDGDAQRGADSHVRKWRLRPPFARTNLSALRDLQFGWHSSDYWLDGSFLT